MVVKKLLRHQQLILQSPFIYPDIRFHFLIAGYASGKSSALGDCVLHAVQYFLGKKDLEGHNPKIGLCAKSLTFLKKTVSGALVQILQNTQSEYKYDKAHNIIYIGNIEIMLIPTENPQDIYGYDLCCAFVDELDELPTYTAEEVVKSINDRCRQNVQDARAPWMTFTTTSQGLKGTYQTIMQFKKQGIGYIIVRARTKDNIYLEKEYVESMYRIYNEKERKCLLEGEFISIDSGLVFPDYNPSVNDLDDSGNEIWRNIKPYETVYIGQDFNSGFNHAQAFVVRKGIIFMIKEYDFPDDRSAPKVFRRDFPDCHIRWIPDMTSKNQFMMYAQELNNRNIHVALRNKNPEISDRNFGVNKCFYAKRLYICSTCKRSKTSLLTHQKDPKTGKPLKGGIGSPDHDSDCLGMAVYYMLSWREDLADIYDVTIGRRISKNREYYDKEEDVYENLDKIPELHKEDVIV